MALPTYVTSHKGDAVRKWFWLLKLDSPAPQYLTDCDQPITYGGNTYVPTVPMEITGVSATTTGRDIVSATVRVSNKTPGGEAAFGILVSGFVGANRASSATIYEVWLDATTESLAIAGSGTAVYPVLVGRVDSPSWDSQWVTFKIVPPIDGEAEKLPWRRYQTSCTYRVFKGVECGYAGAGTSCDRSWSQCVTYSNTARFGGFKCLPQEEEVRLGLGQSQATEITVKVRGR